jgi:hypothetical protein
LAYLRSREPLGLESFPRPIDFRKLFPEVAQFNSVTRQGRCPPASLCSSQSRLSNYGF